MAAKLGSFNYNFQEKRKRLLFVQKGCSYSELGGFSSSGVEQSLCLCHRSLSLVLIPFSFFFGTLFKSSIPSVPGSNYSIFVHIGRRRNFVSLCTHPMRIMNSSSASSPMLKTTEGEEFKFSKENVKKE
ncbi:hypothetical protein C1H46_020040 [Malus baccata]|uniref:Uncharacterized protein n=1 Tax=Malus baccata TaxID=106549 RepID=A0A540M6I1_MALBA|nr:hypothetical protein C1H46_020040 [Malus baccata]